MPEEKFEAHLQKTIAVAVAAVEGVAGVIAAAKAERHKAQAERREAREKELATRLTALPKAKFGVILADPEWPFDVWSDKGLTNTSAANHYPTSDIETIKQRNVASISADDCVLFLWATVPISHRPSK